MSTETTQASPTPAIQAAPPLMPEPTARCARCGSTDLGSGAVLADRPKFRALRFITRGLPLWRARRLFRLGRFTLEIECQVCRSCGYLMLSVDADRLRQIEKKYPAS